jgi:hypothetical protein
MRLNGIRLARLARCMSKATEKKNQKMGYIALSLSSFPVALPAIPCRCRSRPAANRFYVRFSLRPPSNVINIILLPYETCPPKDPAIGPNQSGLLPCFIA